MPMLGEDEVSRRLQDYDILPTQQRVQIARLLLVRDQHLSADQVLELVKAGGNRVSKATVYNTLNLFSQHGLVREVSVDPERRFYDSTNTAHHHFYNVDSGELTDIHADEVQFSRFPDLPVGTLADSVDVVIKVRDKA